MPFRGLLRLAHPTFFPLGFAARLPYATSSLATLVLLQASTGSYAFAGLASGAQSIATAVSGPVIGTLADRYGHRRVGVVTGLASIAALLALIAVLHAPRPVILLVATLSGLAQPQVNALVRAHWSSLIRASDQAALLPTALSYEAAADDTSFVAGPALVGLLMPISTVLPTVATVLLLAGATVPFALRHSHPPLPRQRHSAGQPLPWRPLLVLFVAMVAIGAVFGAVQTGVTAYANTAGQPGLAGLVYAEFGVGSALTGLACAWLPRRFGLHWRYVVFAGTLLAGMLALLVGDVPAGVALGSVTVAPYLVTLFALTERLAPPHRVAAAITVLCAGGPVGTAIGRAVAGVLAQDHGASGAFLVAPVAAGFALLLAVVTVTGTRLVAAPPPGELRPVDALTR